MGFRYTIDDLREAHPELKSYTDVELSYNIETIYRGFQEHLEKSELVTDCLHRSDILIEKEGEIDEPMFYVVNGKLVNMFLTPVTPLQVVGGKNPQVIIFDKDEDAAAILLKELKKYASTQKTKKPK